MLVILVMVEVNLVESDIMDLHATTITCVNQGTRLWERQVTCITPNEKKEDERKLNFCLV